MQTTTMEAGHEPPHRGALPRLAAAREANPAWMCSTASRGGGAVPRPTGDLPGGPAQVDRPRGGEGRQVLTAPTGPAQEALLASTRTSEHGAQVYRDAYEAGWWAQGRAPFTCSTSLAAGPIAWSG